MKVKNHLAIEVNLLRRPHKQFDGALVVWDHFRLEVRLTQRLFPEGDQSFLNKQLVRVSL